MSTAAVIEQGLEASLAQNLVALRKARGLTQSALARIAGVPRSTLAWIESGSGNPSLRNLARLSAALQVGIEELLSRPRPDCLLVAAADVLVQKRASGCRIFKLLPDRVPGLEIDRMEIDGGGWLRGVPHLERTKEYLTAISGTVRVHVAGEAFAVGPGDVLAFPGDRPHSYHNPGREPAVCLSVVALATAGA